MEKNRLQANATDADLIRHYKETDNPEILGTLFKRYTRFVFLVSMKYMKNKDESHDIVMVVFEKLFVDLKKHDVLNFKAWLHTVVRNQCLLKLRGEQYTLKHQDIYKKEKINDVEIEPDFHLTNEKLKEEKLNELEKAVEELKPEQRVCVDLFYLKEKTYNEIAEQTGYTLNQVKSFIQNGKRNLKIRLTEKGAFGETLLLFFLFDIF